MDTDRYEKHMALGEEQLGEARLVLGRGVKEEISEEIALLCADMRLKYTIDSMENARTRIRQRIQEKEDKKNV